MSAWSETLAEVKRKRDEIKCTNSGCWYRGVGSIAHGLLPKLIWKSKKDNTEANLYKDYLRTRMAASQLNSWTALIDMQHYGTATRLLDWTECFGVALFFALLGEEQNSKRAIWLLNPFSLACRARGTNDKSIGAFHLDPEMDYYVRFIKNGVTWPYKTPMPFHCPTPNERIRAQRGFFTVHGQSDESLHLTASRHVRSILIPNDAMADAKEFLSLAGIDHGTMFPDHEGWLKKIDAQYFYGR